jgi:glucose-6-phosphate dehydrogenase assembly protein OpcA
MSAVIQPEKVLRELHELWDQLGREQTSSGGVLRACAMTLLVIAGDEADADQVRRTLGVLMHDHPSRAILLRVGTEPSGAAGDSPGKINEMSARVFAECWMPFSGNQQICAEGIEITAGAAQLTDAARLLVPLIVPDLPVVLWCRGTPTFSPRTFEPLFRLAGKVIFDSSFAAEPRAAIAAVQALHAGGLRVADLAWTRLTGWRELIANGCEDAVVAPGDVSSVKIQFGGAAPSAMVMYFTAWIEQALPSARVTAGPAPGEPGLRSVTLSGAGSEITISLTDFSSVEVRTAGRGCRSLLPPVSDDALMREELSILEGDSVFDRVLLRFK